MTRLSKSSGKDKPDIKEVTAVASENLTANDDQVAVAAYFKAEKRQFEFGHELEDWFEAKAELTTEKE